MHKFPVCLYSVCTESDALHLETAACTTVSTKLKMEDMESSAKKAELESDQMKQLLGLLQKEAPENNVRTLFVCIKRL